MGQERVSTGKQTDTAEKISRNAGIISKSVGNDSGIGVGMGDGI